MRIDPKKIDEFAEIIVVNLEGYSDEKPETTVKSDPGNRTIYGISTKYWPEVGSLFDNNKFKMREAKSFLIKNFFTNFKMMDRLPPPLQFLYFDARIHGEEIELTRLLQFFINKSLANVKNFKSLNGDGKLGPLTIRGLSTILEYNMLDEFFNVYDKSANSIAKIIGGKTEVSQIVQGLEIRDFSIGYENRIRNRIQYAKSFRI